MKMFIDYCCVVINLYLLSAVRGLVAALGGHEIVITREAPQKCIKCLINSSQIRQQKHNYITQ